MPTSLRENDQEVLDFVLEFGITDVLDIGPGSGTYSDLLRSHLNRIECIEIWQPYVRRFNLDQKYDDVTVGDVRDIAWATTPQPPPFDLIIFGDVLEHMTREESLEVWNWAPSQARWGLISVPIVHWPQGAEEGNPFETHIQEELSVEDMESTFGPFQITHVFDQTATFIRKF